MRDVVTIEDALAEVRRLREENDRLSALACDQCSDGCGYYTITLDGGEPERVTCVCVSETEPYRELHQALIDARDEVEEATAAVGVAEALQEQERERAAAAERERDEAIDREQHRHAQARKIAAERDEARAEAERLRLALRNVRALAKRLHRTDPENAAHLLRFYDDAGVHDQILREAR